MEEQRDSLISVEGNSHVAVTAIRNVQIRAKHSAAACNPLLKGSAPGLRAGLQFNHGPAGRPTACCIYTGTSSHSNTKTRQRSSQTAASPHTRGDQSTCNTLRHAATRMDSRMSRVPIVLRLSVAFLISSKKRSKSKVLNSNSAPSFHVLPDPLPTYSTDAMQFELLASLLNDTNMNLQTKEPTVDKNCI